MKTVIVVGGGAAGFFTAINIKEKNPNLEVILLEKRKKILQKVRISGGGRCNLTNACFDIRELVKFYPRGAKELIGPFNQFMPQNTFAWFEQHGVNLKIENDNRVFPQANTSQAIINCFIQTADALGIKILLAQGVLDIDKQNNKWCVSTATSKFNADYLVMTTGSDRAIWNLCAKLGHSVIAPVPSLFTFNICDNPLTALSGLSVPNSTVKIIGSNFATTGAILITHWGLSGPAILKLSAFAARYLAEKEYIYDIEINWLSQNHQSVLDELGNLKLTHSKKQIHTKSPFPDIPHRLWEYLLQKANIAPNLRWSDISKKQLQQIADQLTQIRYSANGQTTFKEEFVTAGGIELKEINLKRFESKLHNNLFFAGEILNIDAVTGGFNFQNAWTGGYIVAKTIAEN